MLHERDFTINKNLSKLGQSDHSPLTSLHLSNSAQPQTWFTQLPRNLHSREESRHGGVELAEQEGDVRVIEAFQIIALLVWEFTASSVTTVANP